MGWQKLVLWAQPRDPKYFLLLPLLLSMFSNRLGGEGRGGQCMLFNSVEQSSPWCRKYLDVHSMDLIDKAQTTDELKRVLAELFQLQGWESDPRAAILLDLYFYTVQFSREHSFNREQSSAFFAIVKDIHEACVETPLSNVEECYRYFTELLFCHAIRRPPFSIDLFSQEQLALMSDYMVNTYFRHFKLYKYAFTPQVQCLLGKGTASHTQHPQGTWPPPLWVSMQTFLQRVPEGCLTTPFTPLSSTGPRDPLRDYISAQLCQEVAQLRLVVQEQLQASEEQFCTKLAQLEKVPSSAKGGGRGRRK
uniref:Coiled-coil domain containing 189 n=1 Tax=Pelusios castaneus TaxID=367368 RepID=A0A8C8RGS1_9SAUR